MSFVKCSTFNEKVGLLEDGLAKKLGSLTDCKGGKIADGTSVATCRDLNDAVAAIRIPEPPADRSLKGAVFENGVLKLTVGEAGNTDNERVLSVAVAPAAAAGNGLKGDGTADNPLAVKHDETLVIKDGKLSVAPVGCARVTNLTQTAGSGIGKLGISCFDLVRDIRGMRNWDLLGIPVNPVADTATQPAAIASSVIPDEVKTVFGRDSAAAHFSGWQVATPSEITQYLSFDGHFWSRTNLYGMADDGSVADISSWTDWKRLDELPPQPVADAPLSLTGASISGNTLTFTKSSGEPTRIDLPAAQAGGLDCDAFGRLPKKLWQKGTTVLARDAQGNCHQLQAFEDLFTDVGVALTADRYTGLVEDNYRVTYTVSNSGLNTAPNTTLTIVKPQGGSYRLGEPEILKQGAASVTPGGDTFKIAGLQKGGRVTVTYPVTFNAAGTLQFGGQVVTDGVDIIAANNRASLALSASKANTASVTASCPPIDVTDLETGKKLLVTDGTFPDQNFNTFGVIAYGQKLNVYMKRDTLRGLQLRIPADTTVVCYAGNRSDIYVSSNSPRAIQGRRSGFASDSIYTVLHGNVTRVDEGGFAAVAPEIENGVLTLPDAKGVLLGLRPAGSLCNWQQVVIVAGEEGTGCGIAPGQGYTVGALIYPDADEHNRYKSDVAMMDSDEDFILAIVRNTGGVGGTGRAVITHQAGTAKTVTVRAGCPNFFKERSAGNIVITPQGDGSSTLVEIKPTATSRDSAVFGQVEIKIGD